MKFRNTRSAYTYIKKTGWKSFILHIPKDSQDIGFAHMLRVELSIRSISFCNEYRDNSGHFDQSRFLQELSHVSLR